MKPFIIFIFILCSFSIKAQDNFKNKTWQETIRYLQEHKNEILDFHYYTPQKLQTVTLKDSLLTIKVLEGNTKYMHKVHFKNLQQIRDYKSDGLLLTFGWKNAYFSKVNLLKNKIVEESNGMHFGVRIDDDEIRKKFKNAFNRLIILNKENANKRL